MMLPDVSNWSDDGLEGVVKSIFMPGVNSGVIRFLSITFIALFLNNVGLLIFFGPNPHVIVLLLLTIGLAAAMAWFVKELQKATREQEAKKETEGKEDSKEDSGSTDTQQTNAGKKDTKRRQATKAKKSAKDK
ncbi:hypothetical protein PTSG_03110 [Salpingoeca rosetta]|uniref:Uncharacterized protein n=1 Tax=Salpingoeca rosetta (strain ATCC 50818 / BSB-021) TaxID=946362 RepID=F2U494_SALR5|nr:uncharacterized protein PTSG_03110 [Salpingoeca rosetta]EGD82460.1 hypothetical protein PTSG_03110 [Salpingoeca rosetta]|eukprot:XP_004995696.1 hypothetical protein PTSG_03110 [Salpingoeca rosetta]